MLWNVSNQSRSDRACVRQGPYIHELWRAHFTDAGVGNILFSVEEWKQTILNCRSVLLQVWQFWTEGCCLCVQDLSHRSPYKGKDVQSKRWISSTFNQWWFSMSKTSGPMSEKLFLENKRNICINRLNYYYYEEQRTALFSTLSFSGGSPDILAYLRDF